VIEVTQQGDSPAFQTKGDANEDPDSALVTPGQVQGRVMSVGGHLFVIPYIGYVINFADTQTGFILLFAVPVTLLVLNEIWNLVVASRADTTTGDETGSGSAAADAEASDAAGSDAEAAGGGAAAADAETDSSESSDGGITFTAAELQLGLIVLAAFLAYGVWVAYETREIWSFGVLGGVASAFLLRTGLYFFGGGSGDATDEGAPDAPPAGTEAEADTDPDPNPDPDSDGEPGRDPEPASAESQAIDPDVELNLLEDVVGQGADGGGHSTPPAAGGLEQHASDGGTPPIAADDRQEPGSEDTDRTADDTGGQAEGETDE
jgi:signal peptidase